MKVSETFVWTIKISLYFVACVGVGILLAKMLTASDDYVKAPSSSCTATYTGAERDASYTTMQCFPTNNNACGMQIPIYNQATPREVRVVCDFTEWR